LLFAVCGVALAASPEPFPVLRGDYLGQPLPGEQPQLFAPGIVCTGMYERDVAVTPDGSEVFFGLIQGQAVTIMHSSRVDGVWTEPRIAPFASDPRFYCLEPCVRPDGRRVFFLSTRPPGDAPVLPGWAYQDIWYSDRQPDGSWGPPVNLGPPVNTEDGEFFPSVTRDGTLYFTRETAETEESSIWRSRLVDGAYAEPEKLADPVNRTSTYNACIAPDESYLLACVRSKEQKTPTYVVFFRSPEGQWSEPVDPGDLVNSSKVGAISPSISPDGRYFFFASAAAAEPDSVPYGTMTVQRFLARHTRPRNGSSDIYWAAASVLERLRERAFPAK